MILFYFAFIKLPQIAPIWVPHKHRKSCNQNPRKQKRKTKPTKKPPHSIIDGNASCQTRGSEDPKQKQNQVHTRIVEAGKKNTCKKRDIKLRQQQQPKIRKKDEQTSKQTKTTKQKRREVISIIIMIIPSAATVATTEVDEVGNLLLLCSMLSRMAVLQFPQRILLRTDGMIVFACF
jgi:cation transport ATPase